MLLCLRSLSTILTLAVFALGLGGCATQKESVPEVGSAAPPPVSTAETGDLEKTALSGPRGGTLLLTSAGSGAKTFNPLIQKESSTSFVIAPLHAGLVYRDLETLEIKPGLAKSWESSPDGKTWTFHLRNGLKWSDGQPLTADDVLFTLDAIFDPKTDTVTREVLKIDGQAPKYEKVDDHTVRVSLPSSFGPFLDSIMFPILPKHKLEAAWKEGKINETWGVDTTPDQLVGAGPYRLTQYAASEKAVYQRNPHYWKLAQDGQPLPFVENRIGQFVPDQNAMLLKFRAGESDMLGVRAEDWAAIQKDQQSGKYTTRNLGPTWGQQYIAFNLNPRATKVPPYKRDWFSKKEFRQAVSYALNRPSIVDTVHRGLARPLWSPVSEANKTFYNPQVPTYPYNVEKAKTLLRSLGFADKNGNGVLEDGAGHELSFVLITSVQSTQGVATANIIQDDLKKVGMKVIVSPGDFNSIVTRLDNTHDWECVLIGFTANVDPHTAKSIWTSPGHLHLWNPRQEKPATPWEAEIDRIFSDAAKLTDTAKRKALYDRWQVIAAEQLPLIFLVTPDSLSAIKNRVLNTRPSALGLLWNSDELALQS